MPEADVIISFVFLEDCLTSQRSVPCRPDLQRAKDGRPQGRPSPSPAPEGGLPRMTDHRAGPALLQVLKVGYLVLEAAAESLVLRFCNFTSFVCYQTTLCALKTEHAPSLCESPTLRCALCSESAKGETKAQGASIGAEPPGFCLTESGPILPLSGLRIW